ncbi:hypothetical protein CC86DRAFT_252574, partial [Ophiobolus disseminans]
MPQFFDLPRELRDMIYMAVVTWQRPCPSLQDSDAVYGWLWSTSERRICREFGCIFSPERVPSTCANMLAVCHQINNEMMKTIDRARRKNVLFGTIDCIADDGDKHFFEWLSLPLVHTTQTITVLEEKRSCGWAPKVPVVGRLLAAPKRIPTTNEMTTTIIEKLRIDLRCFKHGENDQERLRTSTERTSWAVCEALKRLFDY